MKNGYTVIELIIAFTILGILAAIGVGAVTGNSAVPSKQSCLAAGGKWTEGIQSGDVTQFCTYN